MARKWKGKQAEGSFSIKGTVFSLTILGVVLFVTYLLVYGLYMARI
ncbi:hypothetical protein [Bacillus sp. FJAT-27251]|nr:hypothetical protein [Bacillus sp. FJAT-27251]